MIGDQVGDRHVGLMADGTHHRNAGRENRRGQHLLVERPQVFQAPAAAADDHDVDRQRAALVQPVQVADGGGDLVRGAIALDPDGADDDFGRRPAARPSPVPATTATAAAPRTPA